MKRMPNKKLQSNNPNGTDCYLMLYWIILIKKVIYEYANEIEISFILWLTFYLNFLVFCVTSYTNYIFFKN